MKEFKGKVAVITGAASGIGRSLAERCAQEGMKVVLADIEEEALTLAERDIKALGASTLTVLTDVSMANSVEALAEKTLDTFGAVHLLCNNAGVIANGSAWGSTLSDWKWVMGVNLWGVIHGIHVFVPIMLEQSTECHIVNTASMAGLASPAPTYAMYYVTKHGVVALSEAIYHELAQKGASIGVSVLCPGFVNTRLVGAERNRPIELQNDSADEQRYLADPVNQAIAQGFATLVSNGISPQPVADHVFSAVREDRFYVLVNADPWRRSLRARFDDILEERNPNMPAFQ